MKIVSGSLVTKFKCGACEVTEVDSPLPSDWRKLIVVQRMPISERKIERCICPACDLSSDPAVIAKVAEAAKA